MLCREAVDKCLRLLSFYESLGRLIRKSQINCRVTLPSVFISYSCLNKVPQTRRLKTTKIYSLTVLEARSKNDGRAMFHLKPEEEILSLFLLLIVGGSLRASLAFRCLTGVSATVISWPSSSCVSLCLRMAFSLTLSFC